MVLHFTHYFILCHVSVHQCCLFETRTASDPYCWWRLSKLNNGFKVISPLNNPPCLSLSLSPSRANRWDPHLENQPRLWHSGATVARQRERGRQAVASAGCPQQQQGWTLHPFHTNCYLFSHLAHTYIHTELSWQMDVCVLYFTFTHLFNH